MIVACPHLRKHITLTVQSKRLALLNEFSGKYMEKSVKTGSPFSNVFVTRFSLYQPRIHSGRIYEQRGGAQQGLGCYPGRRAMGYSHVASGRSVVAVGKVFPNRDDTTSVTIGKLWV